MSPSVEWSRVMDLFDEAVEWPADQRPERLHAIESDPGVRAEVEALLRADARADALARAEPPGHPLMAGAERLPRQIGRYQLQRVIGVGGFGTVYEATTPRGDDLVRVAIKVLHAEVVSADDLARFDRERRLLEGLDTPGVARCLDAGTDAHGRPYLVMDLVEGEALDAFCDARRLTVRDRVALLAGICRDVQAAHQRLVAHLDLKPSNILVTATGRSVIVDFGTSKLLDAPGALTTTIRLTPVYASPEQLRHEAVSTASDTYSLGLILFELVTGHWPFGSKGSFASTADRMLGRPPTTRIASQVTAADAADRATSLARLRTDLRGDLRVVLLRALDPAPQSRYATAGALADDLEAWLAGRPIAARRPTVAYRLARLVRRHAWATAAVMAVTAVVIALAAFAWRQQQRSLAEGRRAQQAVAFLYRLLDGASPESGGRRGMTLGELAARGDASLEAGADVPEDVRAGLQSVLGFVAYHEGRESEGLAMARRAAARARMAGHAPTHVDAIARLVTVLLHAGRCDEALSVTPEWDQAAARLAVGDAQVRIAYLTGRARIAQGCQGRLDEAAQLTGEAVARLADLPDTPALGVFRAFVLTAHARALNAQRRLPDARRAIEAGLVQARRHPDGVAPTLSLLRMLSDNAAVGEDFATSARALEEAVALAPGRTTPFAEVRLKASWARRLAQAGERARAATLAREVIAETDRRADDLAQSQWMVLVDAADALQEAGQCADALPLLVRADAQAAGMPRDWRTIRLKVDAFCREDLGDVRSAARAAAEALDVGAAFMPAAPRVQARLTRIARAVVEPSP